MDIYNDDAYLLLADLLSYHSMCNDSHENRKLYDSIINTCFELLYYLFKNKDKKSFKYSLVISSGVKLYYYSIDSIEVLKKNNALFLCTSLDKNHVQPSYPEFNFIYKYKYEIVLQKDSIGINLNNVFKNLSKEDKKDLLYKGNHHDCEQEVLIQIKDIESYIKLEEF